MIKYKYNEETLKPSLTFPGTTDGQTRVYLKYDGHDLGQVLGLEIDALYCEVKTIDAHYLYHLSSFQTLIVYSDIADYSKVGNVKSQLLRALTFHQQVKDEDLTVMFHYDKRTFTNLQNRNVKQNFK